MAIDEERREQTGLYRKCDGQRHGMLALNDLGCTRSGRRLFSGVSCTVPAGQLLRVQGANGAGKTSLLRIICGLLEPTTGEALWRGQGVAGLREEFGRQLIYLGHAAALKDDLSPLENLQAASTLGGQLLDKAQARAALAAAGLAGYVNTPVRRLSQGQRRRSALARLVQGQYAALWVLDEPFTALDAVATGWLAGLVRSQVKAGGIVVLTSHQDVAIDDTPQQVLSL
jgi:heme exporter protein A